MEIYRLDGRGNKDMISDPGFVQDMPPGRGLWAGGGGAGLGAALTLAPPSRWPRTRTTASSSTRGTTTPWR